MKTQFTRIASWLIGGALSLGVITVAQPPVMAEMMRASGVKVFEF